MFKNARSFAHSKCKKKNQHIKSHQQNWQSVFGHNTGVTWFEALINTNSDQKQHDGIFADNLKEKSLP